MNNYVYQYAHRIIKSEDLEGVLNESGADGWRLHTCEPAYMVPENPPEGHKNTTPGGAYVYLVIVMEKVAYVDESDDRKTDQGGAMEMIG